jgi:hypothetical protein
VASTTGRQQKSDTRRVATHGSPLTTASMNKSEVRWRAQSIVYNLIQGWLDERGEPFEEGVKSDEAAVSKELDRLQRKYITGEIKDREARRRRERRDESRTRP